MKNTLYLTISLLFFSSCSQYYLCQTDSDVTLYNSTTANHTTIATVPKGSRVIVQGKPKKYRRVKYKDYLGWAEYPSFRFETRYYITGSLADLSLPSS